jgi:glycosyltransferase involved in cell wall biosynthesis
MELKLKILIHARFYPSIGGIETIASLLAHEWVKLGEEIIVVSDVICPPDKKREFPFPIIYRPSPIKWIKLIRWCDVYLQFNVSLKVIWPRLLVRRPMIFSHQSWYWISRDGGRDWHEQFKLRLAARATNIFASRAIADELKIPGEVIPNPYNNTLFHQNGVANRNCELGFVGRLVSDKGVDGLLNALAQLKGQGLRPKLTIIGDGSERSVLEHLVKTLKLDGQVSFAGAQPQNRVADLLQRYDILVVPSLWPEPFGVVALEGAACGCVVLGSDGGGLPEAIGPAGLTFQRGNVADLTAKLSCLLRHPEEWNRYRAAAKAHLERHQPQSVAMRYLEVMRKQMLKR